MSKPPFNLQSVEIATNIALSTGHRIFQTHRYKQSDIEQVQFLLDIFNPIKNGIVLDAGCGIGEVSKIMSNLRPDLSFFLGNISPYQLSLCPKTERLFPIELDCHDINLRKLDGIMYSSTLCQLDIDLALKQAYSALDGVLLINDMVRNNSNIEDMEQTIAAKVLKKDVLIKSIEQAGFKINAVLTPEYNDSEFRRMLSEIGKEHYADEVYPIIIRAEKGA
jgi:hypothetical protein